MTAGYDDDEGYVSINCTDPETGKPRLLSEQCSTCIGRPGNKMDLRPGRVRQMVQACIQGGDGVACHQTLPYGGHPDFAPAYCRWIYDHYGDQINYFRIIMRLGGFTEVDPPQDEDGEPGHGYHEAGDY